MTDLVLACRAHRARVVEALGLGPLWVLRDRPEADAEADAEAAVEVATADWVIVVQATDDATATQAARLRDAMLAAIAVSPDGGLAIVDRDDRRLERKIAAAGPKVVLVFGIEAATALAGRPVGRGAHRLNVGGREVDVVVTHDPAWLLSHPEAKAEAWRDLCAARAAFDRTPADR